MTERDRESRIFREPVERVFAQADPDDDVLQTVLDEVPYYARVGDQPEATYIIGPDAILLAILAVGSRDGERQSASWLYGQFAEAFGHKPVREAFDSRRHLLATKNFPQISVPGSTLTAISSATGRARERTGRDTFRLHHLLSAILEHQAGMVGDLPQFGSEPTLLQRLLNNLQRQFVSVGENFDRNASRAVDQPGSELADSENSAHLGDANRPAEISQETPPNRPSIPADQIPGFSTDRPGIDTDDSLGVDPDVQAFARLICLKDARPPLSIGLFGGWGAGKSTFMERLEKAIDAITRAEARKRDAVKAGRVKQPPAETPGFLARIAHIRFNAWQYSDANLWASLTTEFFDQLRAGGHDRQGFALHERLIARVKEHVHGLSEGADAARKALEESKTALHEAEKERDEAVAKVQTVASETLGQTLVERLAQAFDDNKDVLIQAGLAEADSKPGDAIKQFAALAKDVRTPGGRIDVLADAVWHSKWRWLALFAWAVIVAIAVLVAFVPDGWTRLIGWTASAIGFVSVLASILVQPVKVIARLVKDTADIAGELETAEHETLRKALATEIEVRAKAEEVETRQAVAARAETALASYAGPPGTPSSPRLLHFLLNDDPETKQIEGQIGLISRARRLFQAVDRIAAKEREKEDPDEDVPERIVLYIDDLDRCSHDQVYAVLQAVHLLLAFELFVVVVGVDVAWVEEAITRQLRDGPQTQGDDDIKRRKRAIDYLQKIFQIPFWLKPLSTVGDNGGSYGRFVTTLVGADAERVPPDVVPRPEPEPEESTNTEIQVHLETPPNGEDAPPSFVVVPDEPLEPERLLETVRLDTREIEFLKSKPIGAIAAHDPRGVKRMINTYRLARARMSREDLDKLLDADRPTYPVLAFFVAVETGQPVEIADAIYGALHTEKYAAVDVDDFLSTTEAAQERLAQAVGANVDAVTLHERWVAVRAALKAARAVRKDQPVMVADGLPIAHLVRRYSFSRKQ